MNDKTLYYASQIAYFNFDEQLYKDMESGIISSITLQQAFETYATRLYDEANDQQRAFYDSIRGFDDAGNEVEKAFFSDWQILRIDDNNSETGYYSTVLLPSESQTAIVAFRGSEDPSTNQLSLDWIIADGGLITGIPTAQQNLAESVMNVVA